MFISNVNDIKNDQLKSSNNDEQHTQANSAYLATINCIRI